MAKPHERDVVTAKAVKDPAFRAELLKDPAAAIEKATGVKLPKGLSVKVIEDSASVVHLVLPPSATSGSLSERELGRVAGGAAGDLTQKAPPDPNCGQANTGQYYPC